jgi:DNA (cytosine-5)-methyltransferase 1
VRVLDLFSGIGGFSLGLERAGMETVAFCEIEPFPRAVLAKHWPEVPCYDDVRTLSAERMAADGVGPVDVICGGFPCQDISPAGRGAGIDGPRSGLWAEFSRLVGEIRPSYVVVENSSALLGRGIDRVLGDLATHGYDAEWDCIPACYVGAPHLRDRAWIVAYPEGSQGLQSPHEADPRTGVGASRHGPFGGCPDARTAWCDEPALDRVVDGLSHRVVADEVSALGNAVVPQIPELIGRAIMAAEASRLAVAA